MCLSWISAPYWTKRQRVSHTHQNEQVPSNFRGSRLPKTTTCSWTLGTTLLAGGSDRRWWGSVSWPERDGFLNPAEQLPGLSNQPRCFISKQSRTAANTGNHVWGHSRKHWPPQRVSSICSNTEFQSCFIPSFQTYLQTCILPTYRPSVLPSLPLTHTRIDPLNTCRGTRIRHVVVEGREKRAQSSRLIASRAFSPLRNIIKCLTGGRGPLGRSKLTITAMTGPKCALRGEHSSPFLRFLPLYHKFMSEKSVRTKITRACKKWKRRLADQCCLATTSRWRSHWTQPFVFKVARPVPAPHKTSVRLLKQISPKNWTYGWQSATFKSSGKKKLDKFMPEKWINIAIGQPLRGRPLK